MKRLLAAVVVALLVIVFHTQPAGAVGGGTAVMTGTVSPDPLLSFFSNPGSTFAIARGMTGSGAFVEDDVVAFQCVVAYSTSGVTNFLVGNGAGDLTCNGVVSMACNVEYIQVGSWERISGECSRPDLGAARIEGVCVVAYVATAAAMQCEFTFI